MARLTKSSYVKIVLVCLLCLLICGTLTGGFAFVRHSIDAWTNPWGDEYRWTPEAGDEFGGFSIDADEVRDISINWAAGSAKVLVVDDAETGGMIQVSETANALTPLRWRNNGGELQIDFGDVHHMFGCHVSNVGSKDLTVLVPQSHADAINTFCLNAASGEYAISDLSCGYLNINQASGKVHITGVTAQTASFAIASGGFDYRGDITGNLGVDQASGQSTFAFQTVNPAVANLSMASGNMQLVLPSPDFQLGLNKLSGSFDCAFETYSKGDTYFGTAPGVDQTSSHLFMDMLSGNFQISKSQ